MFKHCTFYIVGVTGFEPATPWSQTRCATNCATPRERHFFNIARISLALPATPPSTALLFIIVGVTGFEPATPWSQARCATNCATPRRFFTYQASVFLNRRANLALFFYKNNKIAYKNKKQANFLQKITKKVFFPIFYHHHSHNHSHNRNHNLYNDGYPYASSYYDPDRLLQQRHSSVYLLL